MSTRDGEKAIEIPGLGSLEASSASAMSTSLTAQISASPFAARRLGPLLGMAVGDALGTTYEFERIDQPPYPTLALGPATDVIGGGPFDLVAGQVTDDTQLAVCLARSLVAYRGAPGGIDLLDLATRYVGWRQHAFDVGNQTAAAIAALQSGVAVGAAGREVWHRSERRAAGNGSLMRTTPIGVMFAQALRDGRRDIVVEAALADSLITHADPRCAIACAAFDVAIAEGITVPLLVGAHPYEVGAAMLATARSAIPIAGERLRELWRGDADDIAAITAAELALQRDLDAAQAADPELYGDELHMQRTPGFVRVAFRLAFWHLAHTPSWRDALIDVASRGGDADTNGAIVGALLGARDGARAIPGAWIDRVLGATLPGPADWAEAHHPRHLLALVDDLRAPAASL